MYRPNVHPPKEELDQQLRSVIFGPFMGWFDSGLISPQESRRAFGGQSILGRAMQLAGPFLALEFPDKWGIHDDLGWVTGARSRPEGFKAPTTHVLRRGLMVSSGPAT